MRRLLSKAPLRLILVVSFIVQISIAVSVTGWLLTSNGQKAVHDVAIELLGEVSVLARDRIPTYLDAPQTLNAVHFNAFELGQIDLTGDIRSLSPHLLRSLQTFEKLSSTGFADFQRHFIEVRRKENGSLQIGVLDAATGGNLQYYEPTDQGSFIDPVQDIKFLPGSESWQPWYVAAVEAQVPTWSGVHIVQGTKNLAITAAYPVFSDRGNLLGVFSATISLTQINQFLESIPIGESGQVFIVDGAGRLIASSTGEQLYRLANRNGIEEKDLLKATESTDSLTRAVAEGLVDPLNQLDLRQSVQAFELMINRERKFIQITSLQEYAALDWRIVVVVPESDFIKQTYDNTRNTIWWCFGALVLATGSSILTTHWITQPLLQLNQAAQEMAQGDSQQRPLQEMMTTGRIREVDELVISFNQMAEHLQTSFNRLQSLNTELTNHENRLKQFLEALPVGISVHDSSGRLTYINQVGKKILAIKDIPEVEIDQIAAILRLYKAETEAPYPCAEMPIMRALRGETTYLDNGELRRVDRIIPMEAWTSPVFDEQGEVAYAISAFQDISERKHSEAALKESEARFLLMSDSAPVLIWVSDTNGACTFFNQTWLKFTGRTADQEVGDGWAEGVHPDDFQRCIATYQAALKQRQPFRIEYRLKRADGEYRWILDHGTPRFTSDGEFAGFIGSCVDISDRKQAENRLQDLTDRLELAARSLNMGIWDWDVVNNRLNWDNRMYELYGICPEDFDEVYEAWEARLHPDDLLTGQRAIQQALQGEKDFEVEFRVVWPDGSVRHIESYALVQRDFEGYPLRMIGVNLDISDRKQAEAQLIYNTLHDSLTDLPNRNLLMNRLEQAIDRAQQSDTYRFAILFLDLDQFKIVNDSLGHLVGDQLLITISNKLRSILRPNDLAARLGGDEFVILLEEIADIQAVVQMAKRIFTELEGTSSIDGRNVFITTSIGIVLGTATYTAASDLLRDADIALHRAKARGRAKYEIFDAEMHIQALKRMNLEHDLHQAIDQQEFVVHYQPIIDLNTRQLVGFEALTRWQHPTKGFISPADFIPVAEETGLIVPISRWVLQVACQQLADWQRQFPEMNHLRVSVNLSGQDLRETTLVEILQKILNYTQLPATSLALEITESMLVENIETTMSLLGQLRECGVRISIDDFGTGYSSLSYLYNLPVDYLKIDKSFVSTMQKGNKNYKIVQAIVALSNQLQIGAIAEGIETGEQLEWLQELDCELGQGYLLSRPLAPEAATAFLAIRNL